MRKPTGNLSDLPYSTRVALHERLRDEPKLLDIVRWLFAQQDGAGRPLGERWAGNGNPEHACESALSRYRQSAAYKQWLSQDTTNGTVGYLVSKMEGMLASAGGSNGLAEAAAFNRTVQSALFDALVSLLGNKPTMQDLAVFGATAAKLTRGLVSIEQVRQAEARLEALQQQVAQAQEILRGPSVSHADALAALSRVLDADGAASPRSAPEAAKA